MMMKKYVLAAAGGMMLSFALASGAQIVVHIAPPPRPEEAAPPIPSEHPGWVWQPGYHRWDNDHYTWVAGAYVQPPYEHAHWIEGHWDRRGEDWIWVPGHWDHAE
jgi:hypothetical protein